MNNRFLFLARFAGLNAGVLSVALAGWSGLASAQMQGLQAPDSSATSRASDPATPVPPAQYRSTMARLQKGEDAVQDWRGANDAVGQFKRGHIDLLRLEPAPASPQPAPGVPRSQP